MFGDYFVDTEKVKYVRETDLLIYGHTESESDIPFGINSKKFSTASRLFRVTARCQDSLKGHEVYQMSKDVC